MPLLRGLVLSAIAAAGAALALAIFASPARAWNWQDLPSLGYSVNGASLGNNCNWITVSGYGSSATLGNSCDTDFQARVDAFVEATCPCAKTTTTPTPATTDTVATTTTAPSPSTTPTTTTTPPATTDVTTTPPPPPPPPPSTTTVVVPAQPPTADFAATELNPLVVSFVDGSTPGSAPINSHVWQFGDGAAGTGTNVAHAFPGPGSYDVTLITVDANGLTSIVVRQLTIAPDNTTITLGPRQVAAHAPAKPVVKAAKPAAKKAVKKPTRHRAKKHRR